MRSINSLHNPHNSMRRTISILICLAGWSAALPAGAITVAALQKEIASGAKITVIDLRDTMSFVQGHIPNAINVPASLCPQKHLPPLGNVVVYDDGLGRRGTAELDRAASALAAKPGLKVDILQGGFAAWEAAEALTTRGRGLQHESFNYITYSELHEAAASDMVLVDLRKLTPAVLKNSDGLTDLNQEFPGKRVASAPPNAEAASPLVVLIDSGDGSAETAARTLKARGVRRYAILAGGELAIARKGRPGSERSAPGNTRPDSNQKPLPTGQIGP
jgi:rhodanese-related sulfurtransferase